eukprot:scaffold34747_cov107-Isochrysis_galbana.AAC.2
MDWGCDAGAPYVCSSQCARESCPCHQGGPVCSERCPTVATVGPSPQQHLPEQARGGAQARRTSTRWLNGRTGLPTLPYRRATDSGLVS